MMRCGVACYAKLAVANIECCNFHQHVPVATAFCRYRGKLLDEAEVALETSTANTQAVAAKAKQQYKQGSWNFCQTVMILLAVTVIFSGMLVYIKLTSMFGLKGRL